jgi:hypothetical protein
MAGAGILGEYKGSQAREVVVTLEEYERIREQMEAEQGEEGSAEESSSSAPAYITEGQRGYISTSGDDE